MGSQSQTLEGPSVTLHQSHLSRIILLRSALLTGWDATLARMVSFSDISKAICSCLALRSACLSDNFRWSETLRVWWVWMV